MNYDPMKFCNTCRTPKPRESFRGIRTGKPGRPRTACAEYHAKSEEARERIKQEAVS